MLWIYFFLGGVGRASRARRWPPSLREAACLWEWGNDSTSLCRYNPLRIVAALGPPKCMYARSWVFLLPFLFFACVHILFVLALVVCCSCWLLRSKCLLCWLLLCLLLVVLVWRCGVFGGFLFVILLLVLSCVCFLSSGFCCCCSSCSCSCCCLPVAVSSLALAAPFCFYSCSSLLWLSCFVVLGFVLWLCRAFRFSSKDKKMMV